MDYYQGIVTDYLRADRSVFVNTECCIQIEASPDPDTNGKHWFCDIAAVDLRSKPTPTMFLCEVSYAQKLAALTRRLKQWAEHWDDVHAALKRDCNIPDDWPVRPWLFVPQALVKCLVDKLAPITRPDGTPVFKPRITTLESVQPWNFPDWNHRDCETDKSDTDIPEAMRV